MTRPSIDKIGSWLEGHLTKFIAGEGENSPRPEENKFNMQPSQGPFSHYSAISSAIPSADPSPYASSTNLTSTTGPPQPPPVRTGSAMALRTSTASPHLHINRSSSAMDHVRPLDRRSPVHRIASASASSTGFGQHKSVYGQLNGYGPGQGTTSGLTTVENSPASDADDFSLNGESEQRSGTSSPWWDTAHHEGLNSRTPTATTFMRPEGENDSGDTSGFVSLMPSAPTFGAQPTSSTNTPSSVREEEEEDDDLGLGNSRSKQATPNNESNGSATSEKPTAQTETRPGKQNHPVSTKLTLTLTSRAQTYAGSVWILAEQMVEERCNISWTSQSQSWRGDRVLLR
jgi:hypothetical protein